LALPTQHFLEKKVSKTLVINTAAMNLTDFFVVFDRRANGFVEAILTKDLSAALRKADKQQQEAYEHSR